MRIHTLRDPVQSKYTSIFLMRHQKSHLIPKFSGKIPRPRLSPGRGHTFIANISNRNIHQHFARNIKRCLFLRNLQVKYCRTKCVNLYSRNEGQDFTRTISYGKISRGPFLMEISGKMRCPRTRTPILRESAQSKHMSRFGNDHFIRKFIGKQIAPQSEHPDQAPAFIATVRIL